MAYAKTLAGMANNQGGRIMFGIQDSPHVPVGLKNDKFAKFDPRQLNQVFMQCFSTDVDWKVGTFEIEKTELAYLEVEYESTRASA